MKQVKMIFHSVFQVSSIFFLFNLTVANETSCETSQKLFADLCFTPSPNIPDTHFEELQKSEPGKRQSHVYIHIGNDIELLHLSELVKGKLLSANDDFSGSCFYITVEHGENATGDGKIAGYGNLLSEWDCKPSIDFHGAERCDARSTLSKYHEEFMFYTSYEDNKTGFAIYISCYPNGQVGWGTYSKSPKLTSQENKFALEYAEKLGFPKDTIAVLYGDKCALK